MAGAAHPKPVDPGGGGGGGYGGSIPTLYPAGGQGGLGGGSSAAGPWGSSPVTPAIVAARYGPQNGENRFNLPVGSTSGWRSYDVDRPTILWAGNAIIAGPIFYSAVQPVCNSINGSGISVPTFSVSTGPASSDAVQSSVRHGICYLSGPGRWWLYNAGTAMQEMLAIDASDPAVAARYLDESGSAKWSNGAVVNVTTSSAIIVNENRARGATILVHTALDGLGSAFTAPVWLSFEAAAAVGTGLALLSGQSLVLSGNINYRGRIRAIIAAGVNGCNVSVQEVTS